MSKPGALALVLALSMSSSAIALADSPPAPPAPRMQMNLQVAITDGKVVRTHQLFVVGSDCSEVTDEQYDHVETIHACAEPVGQGIEVHLDWRTKTGMDTPHASSTTGKQSLLVTRNVKYPISNDAVSVSLIVK